MGSRWMALSIAWMVPLCAWAQPEREALRAQARQQVVETMYQRTVQQLQLDAATAARFRQVFDRYRATIEAARKQAAPSMRELRQQLQTPQPDPARLTQLTDYLIAHRAQIQQLEAQRLQEYRRVLTPAQLARLIVLGPKIHRGVQLQMWRALRGGQPPADDELGDERN